MKMQIENGTAAPMLVYSEPYLQAYDLVPGDTLSLDGITGEFPASRLLVFRDESDAVEIAIYTDDPIVATKDGNVVKPRYL